MSAQLHNHDFYTWTHQQAELLREGRFNELDTEHLIEELASMGARERRELGNRLAILLAHLLKWQYQPHLRGSSWRQSIRNARIAVEKIVKDSPSLKSAIAPAVADEYKNAKADAVDETGLRDDLFPTVCPYSEANLLSHDYWPE